MCNLLKEAIKGYSILENSKYIIKLGIIKQGNVTPNSEIELVLNFKSENFYHLFGFQYLENLEDSVNKKVMFKSFRSLVYKELSLSQNRYYNRIITSPSFSNPKVQNRLTVIKNLPYLLDRFLRRNSYWKYEGFKGVLTKIDWNYLITLSSEETPMNVENCLFIRESADEEDCLAPISVVSQNTSNSNYKNYKKDQQRYDIISIQKICL